VGGKNHSDAITAVRRKGKESAVRDPGGLAVCLKIERKMIIFAAKAVS